jgi:hypothetical protein
MQSGEVKRDSIGGDALAARSLRHCNQASTDWEASWHDDTTSPLSAVGRVDT